MNHAQEHPSKSLRKFKHITHNKRHTIETMYRKNITVKEIAAILDIHRSSVYRELKRGQVEHLRSDLTKYQTYSADRAILITEENASNKGPKFKIGTHKLLNQCLSDLMLRGKASPYAALEICKRNLTSPEDIAHTPCLKTLYNYIHHQGFPITPEQMIQKRRKRKSASSYRRQGHKSRLSMSIDHRPEHVNKRNELGHHEMDLVVGPLGTKECLLVITERFSRYEHIIWMPDRTQQSVRRALNKLETHYGKAFKDLFKTITCDNGY